MKGVIAGFTDIHFGKKGNSVIHNEDCLAFVRWFVSEVKKIDRLSAIAFLGDWFENRNAINVMTIDYALNAMELLNSVGVPIYIAVGNHDLHHRENRKVYSTRMFEQFSNVVVVSEITTIGEVLIAPYLFTDEYRELATYQSKTKYWLGHFEFRNFIVTGTDRRMEHGPDHKLFQKPSFILSGHFHKRQAHDNVVYVGSPFPMDFGDQGDAQRGLFMLDIDNDDLDFKDWPEAPLYFKTKLSTLLAEIDTLKFPAGARVKCIVDMEISYMDAQGIKESMMADFSLREFAIEESVLERKRMLEGEDADTALDDVFEGSVDDMVINLLNSNPDNFAMFDTDMLKTIYNNARVVE